MYHNRSFLGISILYIHFGCIILCSNHLYNHFNLFSLFHSNNSGEGYMKNGSGDHGEFESVRLCLLCIIIISIIYYHYYFFTFMHN